MKKRVRRQVDVPEDRQFIGFDAYRNAMDCLKPGDVAIFATPPGFRWVHFGYAIQKGLNVFMEKPVTVDGPTTRKMLALAEESVEEEPQGGRGADGPPLPGPAGTSNALRTARSATSSLMRAYRMHGPSARLRRPQAGGYERTALPDPAVPRFPLGQRRLFSDFYIHQIDECCWMKGAWPIKAQASGGRHYRGDCIDQNFDNYSVEYTFADGAKLFLYGRSMNGCYERVRQPRPWHERARPSSRPRPHAWQVPHLQGTELHQGEYCLGISQPEPNPYRLEWEDLIDAIRQDKPYNEAKRGAKRAWSPAMGRMAAHTGQVVTCDEMLNCEHEFAPNMDKLTMDGPVPLPPLGPDGKYPVPQPGITTQREY